MRVEQVAEVTVRVAGQSPPCVYLTAVPAAPLDTPDDFRRFHGELADELRRRDVTVLQEKLFAAAGATDALTAARDAARAERGLDADTPVTRAVYTPCRGGALAGVQLIGLQGSAPAGVRVRTVRDGGRPVGRELTIGSRRLLWLAGVHAGPTNGRGDPHAAMAGMFARANELLELHGFRFVDVARTWLFVEPLLSWYDELNRVRDRFFERVGVLGPGGTGVLPASTGIQGSHPDGAPCFLDLLAIADDADRARPPFAPVRNPSQCEAYDYGSAFSRGMLAPLGDHRLLLASGTASISPDGRTAHVGDPEGQLRTAYAAVDALLADVGTTALAVVGGVLFFKDEATYRAWRRLRAAGELPGLPGVAVYADVCRDDLLFELETLAVA